MSQEFDYKIINDPEILIKFSEFYLKMSQFQMEHDHKVMALNSYITSKTLLYWARVTLKGETN